MGKTEVAKALSRWTGGELIRLQCYEGIDAAQALYEWDYPKQLLALRGGTAAPDDIWSESYLVRRPLLHAVSTPEGAVPPVLLIDEIDRADDEFEALLLEVLADYSVTVPELGTFRAPRPPVVVLTSNRTRDVHDALKRRCLYHWVDHPGFEREVAIVRLRAPEASERLARQVASVVARFRDVELFKPPGVAETVDWALAIATLGRTDLDAATADATLGAVLKYREDQQRVRELGLAAMVEAAGG